MRLEWKTHARGKEVESGVRDGTKARRDKAKMGGGV